ncbi:ATP-binding protein [Nonomuraea africana]|uniref:Anti-sigma regulatory factor (Ser/Thr protein kinase) n=1 Tax=Nonomuraea africana TaxID=46171 RepID=A0ABR9KNU5_9ACTN|nr:ATP-binding protein [Nonomuraea africana]MBE1563705.1 anti-sigma regulatory factor (Ser/Thr protein kinase) [Nonomuraea africana]
MALQTEQRLAEELDSITVAREIAGRFLQQAAYGGAHDDVLLVVSELVTNALLHGLGPPLFRMSASAAKVRVEVADSGTELPVPREPGPHDGWGLQVIERVCSSWGAIPHEGGKVVWCELVAAPSPATTKSGVVLG